jgi:hypothetical protein
VNSMFQYRQLPGKDFFALWKDADPDIPILKEAKAESLDAFRRITVTDPFALGSI